jgi:hypothetical protein
VGLALGLAAGVLVPVFGRDRAGQLQIAMLTGLLLAAYLTVLSRAYRAGRKITEVLIAPLFSTVFVVVVWGVAVLLFSLAWLIAVFGVPSALVLGAIYFIPWLSFMEQWPGEIIGLYILVFACMEAIIVELVWNRRSRKDEKTALTPSTHSFNPKLYKVREAVSGTIRVSVDSVGWLRSRTGSWTYVAISPYGLGLAIIAALVLFVPLVLVDFYGFGSDLSRVREPSLVTCCVGGIIGGLYGFAIGWVAEVAGYDEEL